MNAKTLRQIEEMKKQTIGVEVEMNNITRNKAAKIAAEFFGTGRYENTADRNGLTERNRIIWEKTRNIWYYIRRSI